MPFMRYFLSTLLLALILALPGSPVLLAQTPAPGPAGNNSANTPTTQDHASNAPAAVDQAEAQTKSLLESVHFSDLWNKNSTVEWLTLLGALFAGLAVGKIVQYFLNRVGQRLIDRKWDVRGHLFADLANPASLLLFTIGLAVGLSQLRMGESLTLFCQKTIKLLISVACFWYLYNLVSVIEVTLTRITAKTESTLDDMLVPLIRKTLRIFLVIIAVLFILDGIFDADIGAWLAGLGIAGLAVSLAAQDSLKNLFGSVTIFLDRPFLVGSFIKYGDNIGTVEEIGFRSTRMRTLSGSVVTIPNAVIVNEAVENIGQRPSIRRVINVTITYDTPPDKIEQAVSIIKEIFQLPGVKEGIHDSEAPDDPKNNPPRVFFNDLNADSLNIVVYYWFRPADYWQYQQHCERFNLELFKRYAEAGIDFAFPTQTLYLAGDEKRQLAVKLLNDAK